MYGGIGGGDGKIERNLLISLFGSSNVEILSAFSSSCDSDPSVSGWLNRGISLSHRASCFPR